MASIAVFVFERPHGMNENLDITNCFECSLLSVVLSGCVYCLCIERMAFPASNERTDPACCADIGASVQLLMAGLTTSENLCRIDNFACRQKGLLRKSIYAGEHTNKQ